MSKDFLSSPVALFCTIRLHVRRGLRFFSSVARVDETLFITSGHKSEQEKLCDHDLCVFSLFEFPHP